MLEIKNKPILEHLVLLTIIRAHVGEKHAIGRVQLLDTMRSRGYELSDRKMRDAISDLRRGTLEGAWICSNLKGDGYYYAENLDELRNHLETERRRGLNILEKVSAQARRAMPELAGQFEIGG